MTSQVAAGAPGAAAVPVQAEERVVHDVFRGRLVASMITASLTRPSACA